MHAIPWKLLASSPSLIGSPHPGVWAKRLSKLCQEVLPGEHDELEIYESSRTGALADLVCAHKCGGGGKSKKQKKKKKKAKAKPAHKEDL